MVCVCFFDCNMHHTVWGLHSVNEQEDVTHETNTETFLLQRLWMAAKHWKGPFLSADTSDSDFKTRYKEVIKSQLQPLSMKSQLNVSVLVLGFRQDDASGTEHQGKRRKMTRNSWKQTQLGTRDVWMLPALKKYINIFITMLLQIIKTLLQCRFQLGIKSTGNSERECFIIKL